VGKFYTIACLVVLGLIFAPVALLSLRKNADYGDRVVLYNSYSAKVKSIDPATCGDTTSAAIQGQCYESLYAYHYLKRPVELVPELAADFPEISDDGLCYTFHLKPNINYMRNACFGRETDDKGGIRCKTRSVCAEDFVLALKRVADFHIPSPLAWTFITERIVGLDDFRKKCGQYKEGDFSRYDLEVAGLRAIDDQTLQIRLTAPYPQLLYVLAIHCYAPIPRELVTYYLTTQESTDNKRSEIPMARRTSQITQVEQVVGTGAYCLTRWERGNLMVFERNPEYQHGVYPSEGASGDRDAGLLDDAGARVPFVDVLHYTCVQESMPAWLQFLSRQTDLSGIPSDVFDVVISPDKQLMSKWSRKGITLTTYGSPAVFWLAFNMHDPVIQGSKSLRHAMCLAFNVEQYIEVLFNGRGRRAVNILPQSFPTYELAGPGAYYRYDPQLAQKKLDEARRELQQTGLLDADGKIPQLTVDLGGRDESSRRMGEFIRQQFEPLGIRVKIELNDWPTLQQKVHNKQCQLYTMGWHADYPDAENFLQLFYGPNIEKGTNNTNYQNPAFDALYDKIKIMSDAGQRQAIYAEMVQILNEDCPVLLLSEPVYFVLKYDWVKSHKPHPFGYGMTKYLRIDTDLRKRMGGR